MESATHRLVYFSRNLLTDSPAALAEGIAAILASARRTNARLGVTGALMFNAGCFAQVLEGPRDAVAQVFERIRRDPRHDDVTLLAFGPEPERAFEHWSMAFIGASHHAAERFAPVAEASGFDPARMTGDALYDYMHRLMLEEERVAG
jgi:hypothetical protein